MDNRSQINKTIVIPVSVYLLWVVTTYLLEGRILTLLRPEAVEDRIAYTVTANIIVGIIIAAWVLHSYLISGFVSTEQMGLRSIRHTITVTVTAGVIGFILFMIQNPPSLNPIVILNVFAQVLTVSVAEVLICWAVIGAGFESITRSKEKVISLLAGILAASISFGIYHFAHSPPFNQVNTVILLTIISFTTSIVYFIGRNIYAAIVFHNTLALFGVMQALERSGNLLSYGQPVYPLIAMALVSVIIFVIFDILYIRRIKEVRI
ncbi:MAG: hypothetical protein OIN83_10230 [Candidatus Methanoperedens sp.]|nr:hypothetical protein [Candidatus Methanoperedens sp.]